MGRAEPRRPHCRLHTVGVEARPHVRAMTQALGVQHFASGHPGPWALSMQSRGCSTWFTCLRLAALFPAAYKVPDWAQALSPTSELPGCETMLGFQGGQVGSRKARRAQHPQLGSRGPQSDAWPKASSIPAQAPCQLDREARAGRNQGHTISSWLWQSGRREEDAQCQAQHCQRQLTPSALASECPAPPPHLPCH